MALACSADEVQAFRVEKEAETLAAAKKQKRDPGQLTMKETVKRLRARCTHCVAVASEPSKPTATSENPLPQSGHVSLEIPTAHACQNLHAS